MLAEYQLELFRTLCGSAAVSMEYKRLGVRLALIVQLAGISNTGRKLYSRLQYSRVRIAGSEKRPIAELTFEKVKSCIGRKMCQ